MSEESRVKMRAAWARRRELGIRSPKLGVPRTTAEREAIAAVVRERTPRGSAHYNWKGGITPSQKRKRKGRRYYAWRSEVRARAAGSCEACQCERAPMHAHHIKPFAEFPELRLDPENGAWLCSDCHREVHAA
jgi:5-methylcytosine-specific restriction endonuclease McrA